MSTRRERIVVATFVLEYEEREEIVHQQIVDLDEGLAPCAKLPWALLQNAEIRLQVRHLDGVARHFTDAAESLWPDAFFGAEP